VGGGLRRRKRASGLSSNVTDLGKPPVNPGETAVHDSRQFIGFSDHEEIRQCSLGCR
jgi:hypothetical protein